MVKTKTKEAQPDLLGEAPKAAGHVAPAGPAPKKLPTVRSSVKKPGTALAVARPTEPQSVLSIIAAASRDPNFNPANMKALLDMRREEIAEAARMASIRDFSALQAELPSIRQDRKIEIRKKDATGERTGAVQQATPYATFNNIMTVIKPLLRKHHFNLHFTTSPFADGRLLVRGILDHDDGHQRVTEFALPAETSGSKNNLQGWGSSQSYGKRYAMIALLNIISHAPEDADTDGNFDKNLKPSKNGFAEVDDPKPISRAQLDELVKQIVASGLKLERFLIHYGIEKVADLSAELYEPALKQIADYVANKKAAANG
jgi:ERF superfamily